VGAEAAAPRPPHSGHRCSWERAARLVSVRHSESTPKLAVEGSHIDNLPTRVRVVLKDDLRLVCRDDAIPWQAAIP